jgi:hypothetical protein
VSKVVSLRGRVQNVDGALVLLIPLDVGGNELRECCRGIAEIDGPNLRVTIPDWMADQMGLQEGSLVNVDNEGGKFNLDALEAPAPRTRN